MPLTLPLSSSSSHYLSLFLFLLLTLPFSLSLPPPHTTFLSYSSSSSHYLSLFLFLLLTLPFSLSLPPPHTTFLSFSSSSSHYLSLFLFLLLTPPFSLFLPLLLIISLSPPPPPSISPPPHHHPLSPPPPHHLPLSSSSSSSPSPPPHHHLSSSSLLIIISPLLLLIIISSPPPPHHLPLSSSSSSSSPSLLLLLIIISLSPPPHHHLPLSSSSSSSPSPFFLFLVLLPHPSFFFFFFFFLSLSLPGPPPSPLSLIGASSLQLPTGHKRSGSNVSARSLHCDDEDEIIVFQGEANKKLFCRLCNRVFKDPVIVSCGHTYCRRCVNNHSEGTCPVDNQKLNIVVANIAVSEQVGELVIHCKYGCIPSEDGQPYVVDTTKCPVIVKLNSRGAHENDCDYAPVECPNNVGCPPLLKKDLESHLKICNNVTCPHQKYSCDFIGTQDDLVVHLRTCKFEGMKDFLQRTDEKIAELQFSLVTKEHEIGFLRSMLGKLSERVENLEKTVDMRVDLLEHKQNCIMTEVIDNRRENALVAEEISNINKRLNIGVQMGANLLFYFYSLSLSLSLSLILG
ncbi:TRAF7 [Acanthosepion pharaonis]|uniref:TRAF7 n=1 Tax=Acanthosepion pharaonis TaxID=158019 RepID=A0A812DIG6_ACAPH|nr:TRAF7 [Sepia pharaonis]